MNSIKKTALFLKQRSYQIALGVTAAAVSASASAAIDVTAATSAITEGVAAVGAIGGAVLAVWGVRKVYSLIAR